MKKSLRSVRIVFLIAALVGAVWLPSREAAAQAWCMYLCDGDSTFTYTGAASLGHCRQDAYNACIPRELGGTYCYEVCESW